MLRTFCSNPALGGFGSESTNSHIPLDAETPDAFCQIVKELVDNAVDACSVAVRKENCMHSKKHSVKKNMHQNTKKLTNAGDDVLPTKRVRVVIESFTDRLETSSSSVKETEKGRELLRVTVSDNGCGMNDIQACVGAFHSSKAHNFIQEKGAKCMSDHSRNASDNFSSNEMQTVGRYGIGLTLCLLHAQRLVPDSCASIQSAISCDNEWKVVTAVVDTDMDKVQCFSRDGIPKSSPTESGTSISILVPGGTCAILAWPRLAEYFARFKLSLGMTCSLEVLAPTLSRVPLWVQPISIAENAMIGKSSSKKQNSHLDNKTAGEKHKEDKCFNHFDIWGEPSSFENNVIRNHGKKCSSSERALSPSQSERIQIWNATKNFLGQSVDLANVAHADVPIRIEKDILEKRNSKCKDALRGPRLTVDVIVHDAKNQNDEFVFNESACEIFGETGNLLTGSEVGLNDTCTNISRPASLVLIRMVNKIPLLDSAEAVACGLVQCLASKKRMWNSFGLDVHLNIDSENASSVPTYDVRDSEQVMPFFKQGAHNLLEDNDDDDTEHVEESNDELDSEHCFIGRKRSKLPNRGSLLPASVRLGSILVVVQIYAEPSTLPLPTLSKGRLPICNKAIDDAFEIGVTQCLQQLQTTNPNLLLTASELRKAECDARYVPAISLALASILSKSTAIESQHYMEMVQGWNDPSRSISSNVVTCCSSDEASLSYHPNAPNVSLNVLKGDDLQLLGLMIERQLRSVLECPAKSTVASVENDADDISCTCNNESSSHTPLEDFDWVPLEKVKKKSKGSRNVYEETPDNEAAVLKEGETYRDFDEWF